MIFGFVICLAVGILCMILGIIVWKKQKLSLIHDYHIQNIQPENVPAYTRQIGAGLILCGAGCWTIGTAIVTEKTGLLIVGLLLGLLIGTAILAGAQIRYGGKGRKY